MRTLKNTIVVMIAFLTIFCMTQSGLAGNSGGTHALEGLFGAKYSGAPSQALAGRMGLLFKDLKSSMNTPFNGTIVHPEELKKLGYKGFQAGDKIQFTRIGENRFKIKHMKSGKEVILNVIS